MWWFGVATVSLPEIAGQGVAWDRSLEDGVGNGNGTGVLYGISRESRQVVEMRVPLQTGCGWDVGLEVGRVLGIGEMVDPES